MAGTLKRTFGPVAMSNTLTTNIYNNSSALVYDVIKHIHIVNKTAGAVTFTLYLGATGGNAAGTEIIGTARSIAANSAFDWYGNLKMVSTDFLVGGASAATSLTITGEGEQFVV
jgi:hypothetical protein